MTLIQQIAELQDERATATGAKASALSRKINKLKAQLEPDQKVEQVATTTPISPFRTEEQKNSYR